jgi:F0F1-type ATP synthase assembly protein I
MAEHNSKKTSTKIEKGVPEKPEEPSQPATGLSDFIGIVLIAAGFFNVPSLLKKPETQSDWMMLVIVLVFLISGFILLFLPRFLQKKRNKN